MQILNLFGIIALLLFALLPLIIFYLIIAAAVKNGIRDAIKDIEDAVRNGVRAAAKDTKVTGVDLKHEISKQKEN